MRNDRPISVPDFVHQMVPVCGVIESVQRQEGETPDSLTSIVPDDNGEFNPEGEGIAKKITYTILLNHPLAGPMRIGGVIPVNDRERDPMQIIPAKIGSGVIGIECNQQFWFTVIERPARKQACTGDQT